MPVVNIPPDHMKAKMRLQHIVQLNCQSAPLKIGHTAESSGGCGTRLEKKKKWAFTEKQEQRENQPKLQKRDNVNSRLHRQTKFQKRIGGKNKTVNKAALKTPTCPSYILNLKGRWHPTELPGGCRFNTI